MTSFESLAHRAWRMLAERAHGWRHEFPTIVRGLWALTEPEGFRKPLLVIASLNLLIVLWDTAQPWILAWGVDALVDKAPYRDIAFAIIFPFAVIAFPYGIGLPLIRELYTVLRFRPQFARHLALRCLPAHGEKAEDGGPAAQAGRGVALPLVDTLLRDPLYIARGVVLLVVLAAMSPLLGAILLSGMALDVVITLLMESALNGHYHRQQAAQLRANAIENDIHSGAVLKLSAQPRLVRSLNEWCATTVFVEVRRLIAQNLLREGCANLVRLCLMLLVGYWVHLGETTVGQYIVFVSLATRANDPLYVFFNLQQTLMQNREVLRRFEKLSGIPFISKAPAEARGSQVVPFPLRKAKAKAARIS